MLTDQQKLERESSLGSSDAPIVCGVSSYGSPLELFYKMHGELPRYDDQETMQQKLGSRLEAVIAEIAAEELGIKIRRISSRVHPKYSWMMAHADFEIVNNPRGPGLMECKNRGGERPWETIPDSVHLQVVHQLAVTNRPYATVAALFQFGILKTYEVERDREMEEYLIEIEQRFIVRVQKGEPPDHTWTPNTVGILRKLYPTDSGQTIALPEKAVGYIAQFLQAKDDLDDVETQKAEAEGALKSMMGEASLATVPGWQLSWKSTKASRKFDVDRFETEQPALYAEYQKIVPGYRRFSIKPSKELA